MRNTLKTFVCLTLLLGLLIRIQSHLQAQAPEQPDSLYWVDWSQNGSRIVTANADGINIYNAEFKLLNSRHYPESSEAISLNSLSPDGSRLAILNQIWDANTLQMLLQFEPSHLLGNWSKDGKSIAAVAFDTNSIAVYDTVTGNLTREISGDFRLKDYPVWSPDSTHFATVDRAKTLIIIDISTGEIIAHYPHEDFLGPIIWSPDGTQLAYGGFAEVEPNTPGSRLNEGSTTGALRDSVYIADATTGQILHTFTGLPYFVTHLAWSPDGTELLAVTGFKEVYIWSAKTGQLIDKYETTGGVIGIDYSPFGGQIMIGFKVNNDTPSVQLGSSIFQATSTRSFLDGAIQMIVPAPSTERLQAIMNECATNQTAVSQVNGLIAAQEFHNFTQAISRLPASDIPPGCAADLIAVAEALQAGQ